MRGKGGRKYHRWRYGYHDNLPYKLGGNHSRDQYWVLNSKIRVTVCWDLNYDVKLKDRIGAATNGSKSLLICLTPTGGVLIAGKTMTVGARCFGGEREM